MDEDKENRLHHPRETRTKKKRKRRMGICGYFKHHRSINTGRGQYTFNELAECLVQRHKANLSYSNVLSGETSDGALEKRKLSRRYSQDAATFQVLDARHPELLDAVFSFLSVRDKIVATGVCHLFYFLLLADDEQRHFGPNLPEYRACPHAYELYYDRVAHVRWWGYDQDSRGCAMKEPLVTSRRAFAIVASIYFRLYGPLPETKKWPPKTAKPKRIVPHRFYGECCIGKAFYLIYNKTQEFDHVRPLLLKYQREHEMRDMTLVDANFDDEVDDDEEFSMLPRDHRRDPFAFLQKEYAYNYVSYDLSRAHVGFLVEIFDRNVDKWMGVGYGDNGPMIMAMVENLRGILATEADPRVVYSLA